MKVLYLVEEYGPSEGRWHQGLFRCLRAWGVEVEVVNLSRSEAFRRGVAPCVQDIRQLGASGDYWRGLPVLRRAIARAGADLVHGIETIPSFYGALARGLLPPPRPPLVYGRHHMRCLRGRARLMERVAFGCAQEVFTVSEEARRAALAGHPRAAEGKVVAIHNGIALEETDPSADEARLLRSLEGDQRSTVLLLARLRPLKGHSVALAAAEAIRSSGRELRWIFAGDGPLGDEIDLEIRRRGLEGTVVRTGRVAAVSRFLRLADVLVAPSLEEAFGLVAIEAMAAGLPVVASRVGGLTEVVVDGSTGILVPPGQPEALADAVGRLVDDPGESRRLGEAGRRRYHERFTPEAMARAHLEAYRRILGERR